MSRQSFLNDDPWDEVHGDKQIGTRMFERPPGPMLGARIIARFELPAEE